VSVSYDERDRVNSEQDEIHYPRLVVEVLSRTTQDYDRTDKFDLYRGCAALQDYVLVSTRRQSVHSITLPMPVHSWSCESSTSVDPDLFWYEFVTSDAGCTRTAGEARARAGVTAQTR
jgi:Uma2 family endonuclease